jgi:pimeloyl-ACP methyl ester carboxylesterase
MDFARGVTTYGNPRNPPILFLHGVRLGGKIWEQHARLLCDEFYVITPDMPGHGALADLPFDIPVNEAFLAYIADRVVSRPPLVVGYSLGGYVAMRYATDMPERTTGLLLTGCSADVVAHRQLLYDLSVAIAAQFPPRFIEKMLTAFFRITLPPAVADVVIPFRFDQRTFALSRRTATGVEYSRRLAGYGKPVLIVNGEWDLLFRPDERKYASAAGARVIVMRKSDHVAPLRRPAEFSAIVRRFANEAFRTERTARQGPLA